MKRLTFEVCWRDGSGRVIGRDEVKRHDLTDAITAACNMLKKGRGQSDYAHGFTVAVKRDAGARG